MTTDYSTRTRTQTIWLAGAAVLLVVLLVGGSALVLRAVTASPPPPSAAAPGEQDPAGLHADDSDVPAWAGGVPWDFALDPAGAAAAGLAVITVTGQAEFAFDPDRFAAAAAVMFTDEQAAIQTRQVEAARTNFEVSGWADQPESRRMYHLAPLAVQLSFYDPETVSATVEVWAMTLVGVGDTGGAVFTTSTIELTADDTAETWRVSELETVEGPVPLVYDSPSAPGRTRATVRDAIPTLPLPLPVLNGFRPDA